MAKTSTGPVHKTSKTSADKAQDAMTVDLFTGLLGESGDSQAVTESANTKTTKAKIATTKDDVVTPRTKIEIPDVVDTVDTVAVETVDVDTVDIVVVEPVKVARINKDEPKSSRRLGGDKDEAAFRTISEVATEIGVQQHVLRFWETKFKQIKPLKRGGGRRYYRPQDVALIKNIYHCLYNEGYTIKGVQRLLKLKKDISDVGITEKADKPQTGVAKTVTKPVMKVAKLEEKPVIANVTPAQTEKRFSANANRAEFEAEVHDVLKELRGMKAMLNTIGNKNGAW